MKRILAIVLSIAILVMAFPFSVFAAEPSIATDTWDGTTVQPTATDADGNVIINTAEELAWIALAGGPATNGINYKVAANSVFDLNGMAGITINSTVEDVQAAAKTWQMRWIQTEDDNSAYAFGGNFDGNGLIVFNASAGAGGGQGYTGLFPVIRQSADGLTQEIKNVQIVASYFVGYHYAGALVGNANAPGTNCVTNFSNITVKNCFITDNANTNVNCNRNAATVIGNVGHNKTTIDNCLVIDTVTVGTNVQGGFIGNSSAFSKGVAINNSVMIGNSVKPEDILDDAKIIEAPAVNATYTNVYTDVACDVTGVTVLTTDKMQGEAAKSNMALAWNINWLVGAEGEYPSINYGDPIKDPYVWDGTFEEPTETDDEGNIIINTVQEMAWIALRGGADTTGKSYKVADGIKAFDMNGAVGITADSTAADVQAATKTSNIWRYAADDKVGGFCGNFDGNGVTIYNIYAVGYGYGALFPFVYNDVNISNVIVKASFLSGYHYAAGIVGLGELQKTININKCIVENCYITDNGNTNTNCRRAAAAFVAGTGNSNVNISNSFAANNTLSAAGYEAGFVATTGDYQPNGVSITNSISIGMYPYSNVKIGALGKGLTEKLTVENVYSDVECDVAGFTTLTTAQMQGEAAKANMALTWNTDWLVGAEGEYPSINFGEPVKDPYVWDGSFKEPTETDDEGNIIINTVHEMAWIALRGGDATIGKNYKVADGVKFFNMNGKVGITANSSVTDVKAAENTGTVWSLAVDNINEAPFQGNFDGNGLTVYNIVTAKQGYSGLFPVVKPASGGSITVKNVAVVASDIRAYHNAGAVIGVANAPDTSTSFTLENCMVKNCFISDGNDANALCQRTAATHVGALSHNATTINNCLAINNELSAQGAVGGFFSNTSNYGGAISVSNSVSIGTNAVVTVLIDGTTMYGSKIAAATYTNVYTDQSSNVSGVTTLENSKMQGAVAAIAMDSLDNSVYFFNATTYPELYIFHDVIDGKCECGLEVAGDPCVDGHSLESVEGYDATNFTNGLLAHDECSVCGKTFIDGVEKSAEELIIPMLAKTWNGTFVEPTTTDANGNIVINTPEELAWVALRGGTATAGKNYIVAKDSVFNLNGMTGITPFSTVAEVKVAIKNDTHKWQNAEDSNDSAPFMGNFNGNGLIVYNLYTAKGRASGGLFPVIKPESNSAVTIKNVTVLASHIGGYHQAGGIVGLANAPDTSTKFALENATVKNCFIYDNDDQNSICHRTTGVLVGDLTHNSSIINNCLVVDNELSAQGIIGGLYGNTSIYGGANTVKNIISIGTSVQSMMVNYAINNKAVTYTNVYTDQIASAEGITTLTVDQMQGAAAADNMNLNWNINWAVGAEGEYPSIITDNAFYDEWDGTFTEPTKTDAEGNIIINSAEEMAWVALRGDAATTGKNYKVADGIKYFNMNGMVGITYNSSADDVLNAAKNDTNKWNYASDGKVGTFQGNFDGNGVIIYNMYAANGQGYGGLFPVAKPSSGETLTIKNVAVVASYFGGYHCAGAIVGLADAPDTSTSLLIENIIVKNNFIYDNDDTNPQCQRTAGVVAGNLTHNATVINNCFASGNELSAQGIIGGLFGNTSAYGTPCAVSNTIVLGTNVEPTSISYAISDKVALTTYTNVYTDQATELTGVATFSVDEMSGENALTNTTLDWSGWFATENLPELRAFHNITSTDNGDGTHNNVCADCDIIGLSTPHTYKDGSCEFCGAACVHVEGEAVEENRINATCTAEGSYESVVYCSVCGEEISRVTMTLEIDKNAHKFTDDADIDCDNGCGYVRITYTPGDVNDDGKINGRDIALMMQHINDWDDVEINVDAADVLRDGKINGKDYAILMQYLNDWDVTLG